MTCMRCGKLTPRDAEVPIETKWSCVILSTMQAKIFQNLKNEIAKELWLLTGKGPSPLITWAKLQSANFGARRTVYGHLGKAGYVPRGKFTSAADVPLPLFSYPFSGVLRFRAISIWTQFSLDVDKKKNRQIIIFFGYEVFSQLLHFRVYRGPAHRTDDAYPHICTDLSVATVRSFVNDCAQLTALPLMRVLFTQELKNFPVPHGGQVGYLPLKAGQPRVAKESNEEVPNEVLYGFADSVLTLQPFSTLQLNHPFSVWCQTTNATALTDCLAEMIRVHNEAIAMPLLVQRHSAFKAQCKKLHDEFPEKFASSPWKPPPLKPFVKRMFEHEKVLDAFTSRSIKSYSPEYENFASLPGDRSRKAGRHGDIGDSDSAD